MSSNNSGWGGGGFTGLLTVAFIVLKLCGVISWGWGWVLAPLWISLAVVLIIVAIALVGYCMWGRD